MTSVWDDVRFDADASEALRRQLAAMAVALVEAVMAVEGDAGRTTETWMGAYRMDFDAELATWSALAAELVASIETAVAAVAMSLEAAEVEHVTRLSLRERLVADGEIVPARSRPAGGPYR